MLEAEALTRLKSMTAWDQLPKLTEDELTFLLADAKVVDSTNYAPTTPGWTGTWNLDLAAMNGWLLKAGKVAGQFDFGSDVNSFSRSQVIKNCNAMIEMYSSRINGTIEATTPLVYYDPVIGNLNGGN